MKKMNKGFSLVELIIVIAIMAILAGALAPALIKYINKSRVSSDISNGQQVASAIQTALSNEAAYDQAQSFSLGTLSAYLASTGNSDKVKDEVTSVIGDPSKVVGKAKKTAQNSSSDQKVYVEVDPVLNKVTVQIGKASADADWYVYPTVGKEWTY